MSNGVCYQMRMYEYIAFDFHLPLAFISSSGTPVEYIWVAQPMRNEWDLNVEVSKPKNLIALCKTDVNWYDVRGFELRWQKRGPWIDGLIVKYCKIDWNKLDVSALKSIWIDIDDREAELDGIPEAGTCADPEATLEGEDCGIETTLAAGQRRARIQRQLHGESQRQHWWALFASLTLNWLRERWVSLLLRCWKWAGYQALWTGGHMATWTCVWLSTWCLKGKQKTEN